MACGDVRTVEKDMHESADCDISGRRSVILFDSVYNGGRYLDMLTQMARNLSAAFGFN